MRQSSLTDLDIITARLLFVKPFFHFYLKICKFCFFFTSQQKNICFFYQKTSKTSPQNKTDVLRGNN